MEVTRNFIRKKIKFGFILVVSIIIIILIGSLYMKITIKQKVDSDMLIGVLEESSELTTAKLTYKGLYKYKDSGISIINRSDFIIEYDAIVKAGIDVSKIKIDSDNISRTVFITIPKAELLDVKITNVEFLDSKFALFNIDSKEDAEKAKVEAELDTREKMQNMGILEMADSQSESLIKGIIQDAIPEGYTVKIKK